MVEYVQGKKFKLTLPADRSDPRIKIPVQANIEETSIFMKIAHAAIDEYKGRESEYTLRGSVSLDSCQRESILLLMKSGNNKNFKSYFSIVYNTTKNSYTVKFRDFV